MNIRKLDWKKGKKAQAAVTDSLFFLMVVVTLCVLMFSYSSTYGDRIKEGTNDLYFKEFTNSAMKTIFHTTIPLDFNLSYDDAREVDYLITALKDDFFSDAKIGGSDTNQLTDHLLKDIVKYNLYHIVKSIMKPIDTYDYIFYIYNKDDGEFEYFMLKKTNFEEDTSYSPEPPYVKTKKYDINQMEYYLCDPSDDSDVINVLSKVNNIYSSSVPLNFITNEDGSREEKSLNTTFAIWPATTDINKTEDIYGSLNCEEYESIELNP